MNAIFFVKAVFLLLLGFYLYLIAFRWKKIDFFSPLIIFPLAYVLYLYVGSLDFVQDQYIISERQWIYYLFGILAFYLGAFIPALNSKISTVKGSRQTGEWDRKRLLVVLFVLFAIALIARFMIYESSGIPLLSKDIMSVRLQASESGYLGQVGMSTEVIFMVSIAGLFMFKKNRLFFIFLIAITLALALLTGTRTSIIRQMFPSIILFHYLVKRVSKKAILTIVLISLIFIGSMSFLRLYREWGPSSTQYLASQNVKPVFYWLYFVSRDFKHGPEGFARVLEVVPQKYGFQYGKLHALPFLFPLPGNQLAPGEVLKQMAGLEFKGVGMAATILAPQYVDFGVLGIILGMFLIGFISEHVYQLARHRNLPVYYLVYGALSITFFLGVRTDYLNFDILWTIFLLIVIHFAAVRRVKER